jgi:hypothetical protein
MTTETATPLKVALTEGLGAGTEEWNQPDEGDLRLTSQPVCPFCGYEEADAWQMLFGEGMESDTSHDCGRCGEEYLCTREIVLYYTTEKPKAPNVALCGERSESERAPGYASF